MRWLVIVILSLVCLPNLKDLRAAQTGEVLASRLNLRTGPGEEYPVLKQLNQGARVTIESRHGGWLQITHAGTQGFVIENEKLIALKRLEPELSNEKKIKELHRKAETIHKQLLDSKNELNVMAAEEKKIISEFDELDRKLSRTRTRVHHTQAALAAIRDQIDQNLHEYGMLEARIQVQEVYAAQRLTALYKLNWLGRVPLLASADSFFDFIQRKSALERILDQDRLVIDDLRSDQVKLESLLERLNNSKTQKHSLELALQKEEAELHSRQSERSLMLKRIRSQKNLESAALDTLEQAARQLESALERAGRGSPAASRAPAASGATPAASGATPAASGATPAASGAPAASGVSLQTAETEEPSFDTHKGLLSWPVQGKIISFFGTQRSGKFDVPTFQSGINIQAERGEPIRAVAAGHTIFSSWFNGFGNTIIIDHGRHYYTVYAHLEETFKVKGDRVQKEEVIATVGDSGSLMGPALHFEVRHHGTPADPLQWIKNG